MCVWSVELLKQARDAEVGLRECILYGVDMVVVV